MSSAKFLGEYTMRGNGPDRTTVRLSLFDGSFKTAYKVVEFTCFTEDPLSSGKDVAGVLKTEGVHGASITIPFWDAHDATQIGWSSQGVKAAADTVTPFSLIDPDNLIVEDLYFTGVCGSDGKPINYLIRLEKYDITEWTGALCLVRARSQNV
jgi:hypothetical protein